MDALNDVLRWTQNLLFVAIGLWALRRWRRFGTEASAWLAWTFGTLSAVVAVSAVAELAGVDPLPRWLGGIVIGLIVTFPYLLLRFHHTFEPVPRAVHLVAGGLVPLFVLGGFVLDLPEQGEPLTGLALVYTVAVVLHWVLVLPYIARRFWAAGRRQPTPARRRLQWLAVGSIVLAVSLLLTATQGQSAVLTLVTQLVAMGAAMAFLVGFAPPRPVRTVWRQPEEDEIGAASLELLRAETPQAVAGVIAPLMQHVVAADRVVLRHQGATLADTGADRAAAAGRRPVEIDIDEGIVQVWPSRYTPFFGADELDVLERIGRLADLALARTTLLASERAARTELEAVNAELEAFVYSASHDLKSPTIAILSYIEILEEEYGEILDEQGRYYLHRMRSNGAYMEALVRDLLELSRVGRRDTAPERVDLAAMLELVAADTGDAVDLVVGDVPVLEVNGLRARQLFQNLVGNAAKHGGRERVRVTIEQADASMHGVTVLVRDDGQGVPAEYRERVFGVFEQLEADEDRDGTGMGLAICRKIMESFGGTVHLTDHDGGAEFALWFPPTALAHDDATDATDTTEGVLT